MLATPLTPRNIGCMSRVAHTCFQGCVRRHGRGDEWMHLWLHSCRPFITGVAVEACGSANHPRFEPMVTDSSGTL